MGQDAAGFTETFLIGDFILQRFFLQNRQTELNAGERPCRGVEHSFSCQAAAFGMRGQQGFEFDALKQQGPGESQLVFLNHRLTVGLTLHRLEHASDSRALQNRSAHQHEEALKMGRQLMAFCQSPGLIAALEHRCDDGAKICERSVNAVIAEQYMGGALQSVLLFRVLEASFVGAEVVFPMGAEPHLATFCSPGGRDPFWFRVVEHQQQMVTDGLEGFQPDQG